VSESKEVVHCNLHGPQGPAYMCQHLNLDEPIGFVEGYDPDNLDDLLFQAWCAECDRALVVEGEWNDRSEAVAKPRLVCRVCYARMKILNEGSEP
jgi:hypothetical protein